MTPPGSGRDAPPRGSDVPPHRARERAERDAVTRRRPDRGRDEDRIGAVARELFGFVGAALYLHDPMAA